MENIYFWFGLGLVVAGTIVAIYEFFAQPSKKQVEKIKEWLLHAVFEAEKEFGSETGILKLHYVYDKFVARYEWVAQVVSFETFKSWVDEVLEDMKDILELNDAIYTHIKHKEVK